MDDNMCSLVVIDIDEVNIEVRFQAWRIRSTTGKKVSYASNVCKDVHFTSKKARNLPVRCIELYITEDTLLNTYVYMNLITAWP
jgi:hypothetical protein